jgi:hypothetical protein
LAIFDEASVLSKVYTGQNKTAATLKAATEGAFKLLLTPTPITMSIMDIYGLIFFIDESVLPDADEFYARYFRKPENYSELASWVSKYSFRTLKSQVTDYVGFSERIPYTVGYELTSQEKILYQKLEQYLALPTKAAYPKMDRYELSLMYYHTLSSSAQALIKTLDGAIARIDDAAEIALLNEVRAAAEAVTINGKTRELQSILKKCFTKLKQLKLPLKAIIFTDNRTTQGHLADLLADYGVLQYSSANSRDYAVMEQFRTDKTVQILIATDEAARGLDIEFCPIAVNYDLLYNAIEMEQRISRCHRQGQQSDVLVINLLGKDNFSDVRILELINKRVSQFEGIFGMSDAIVGNFDSDIDEILSQLRPPQEIKQSFTDTLVAHEPDNRQLVAHTEDTLFTTFTKAVYDKVTITPQYIADKTAEINKDLWAVATCFFEQHDGFEIDEENQTITAEGEPHTLFYYWNGKQNVKYRNQNKYGIAKDFKPHYGRITLTSVIGRGILDNVYCESGGILVIRNAEGGIRNCSIGLYEITVTQGKNRYAADARRYYTFVGHTEDGETLTHEECQRIMALPVVDYIETRDSTVERSNYSNRQYLGGRDKPHVLDTLLDTDSFIKKRQTERGAAQADEIERIKHRTAIAKTKLERSLSFLRTKLKTLTAAEPSAATRIEKIRLQKEITAATRELKQNEQNLFFEELRLEQAMEEEIAAINNAANYTAIVQRQFVVDVNK